MTMRVMPGRADRATAATGDTGPLISALQSDSFPLLARLFSAIYIPPTCQRELQNHGWATYPGSGAPTLHVLRLSSDEDSEAMGVATEIATHPRTSNRDPPRHLGEAEAIVLAGRAAHRDDVILPDERVARDVARRVGLRVTGFPGVLVHAVETGLLTPADVRSRLLICRGHGTRYTLELIDEVYQMATRVWRT